MKNPEELSDTVKSALGKDDITALEKTIVEVSLQAHSSDFSKRFLSHWGIQRLMQVSLRYPENVQLTDAVDNICSTLKEKSKKGGTFTSMISDFGSKVMNSQELSVSISRILQPNWESNLNGQDFNLFIEKLQYFAGTDTNQRNNTFNIQGNIERDPDSLLIKVTQLSRSFRVGHEIPSMIFPSSIMLSRLLYNLPDSTLNGKNIIELGSGCGVFGLCAAKCGSPAKVVLTDKDPLSLRLLRRNVRINKVSATTVEHCDWKYLPDAQSTENPNLSGMFDVVLGSEIVHEGKRHAKLAFVALSRFLKPGGVAILGHWSPHSAFGINDFRKRVKSSFGVSSIATVDVVQEGWIGKGTYKETLFSNNESDVSGLSHQISIITRPL